MRNGDGEGCQGSSPETDSYTAERGSPTENVPREVLGCPSSVNILIGNPILGKNKAFLHTLLEKRKTRETMKNCVN